MPYLRLFGDKDRLPRSPEYRPPHWGLGLGKVCRWIQGCDHGSCFAHLSFKGAGYFICSSSGPGELNYEHTSNCKSLPAPDDCLDLFGLYQKWGNIQEKYIYGIYGTAFTLSERERECAGPMRSPSSILLTTLGVDLFQLGRLWGEKSRMGVCVCHLQT